MSKLIGRQENMLMQVFFLLPAVKPERTQTPSRTHIYIYIETHIHTHTHLCPPTCTAQRTSRSAHKSPNPTQTHLPHLKNVHTQTHATTNALLLSFSKQCSVLIAPVVRNIQHNVFPSPAITVFLPPLPCW